MNRRLRGVSLGLALLALLGIASIAGRGVFAQDATPAPGSANGATTEQTPQRNPFIDAFAAALGVTDQAQIDAAVTTAIDQILAEKVAAGKMTQEQADIIKAEVANGDYRAIGGSFGVGHGAMGDRHGRDHGNTGPGKGRGCPANGKGGKDAMPSTDATPAASSAGVSA